MKTAILLPGIGGSGAAHWQTMWERADPSLIRFDPADWDLPDLDDWLAALDRAIDATDEPPILIAHSLACLLVAHWAARPGARTIRGAFLVAAPDPDGPAFPASHAASFRDVPDAPLPFPTLVVASVDDPYASVEHVRNQASVWNAGLVVAGALGHMNEASNLGDWPLGMMLLEAFSAGARTRQ
jgi:predicted alpha/beta hydrolase family esterase